MPSPSKAKKSASLKAKKMHQVLKYRKQALESKGEDNNPITSAENMNKSNQVLPTSGLDASSYATTSSTHQIEPQDEICKQAVNNTPRKCKMLNKPSKLYVNQCEVLPTSGLDASSYATTSSTQQIEPQDEICKQAVNNTPRKCKMLNKPSKLYVNQCEVLPTSGLDASSYATTSSTQQIEPQDEICKQAVNNTTRKCKMLNKPSKLYVNQCEVSTISSYHSQTIFEPQHTTLPIIAKVYLFLEKEYVYVKSLNGNNCDLSPLEDILRRTAEATGVSEQHVISILNTEGLSDHLPARASSKRRKILQHSAQNYRENNDLIEDDDILQEENEEVIVKFEITEDTETEHELTFEYFYNGDENNKMAIEQIKSEPPDTVCAHSNPSYLEVDPFAPITGCEESVTQEHSTPIRVKVEPGEDEAVTCFYRSNL